jgi:hypothetical protein
VVVVSANVKTLIGVYKADGGILGEVSYLIGHLLGTRECSLCDITHSPLKKKGEFKEFEKRLQAELGIGFRLAHMNERTEAELAASLGKEPCVLRENADGSIEFFLASEELKEASGRVAPFEVLVRSKLRMLP